MKKREIKKKKPDKKPAQKTKQKALIKIHYTPPDGRKLIFSTTSKVVILGRLQSEQPHYLSLKDAKVSAHHARVTMEKKILWIEDLGSTNGTWLGRRKITTKTKLKADSVIKVGDTQLTFETTFSSSTPETRFEGPIPDGTPQEMVPSNESLEDIFLESAASDSARRRLSSFCEMTTLLGEINSQESLLPILLEHIHKTFNEPTRRIRCGIMLGEELMLKAYYPMDSPPTCSFSLARYVRKHNKACLWHSGSQEEVKASESLFRFETQSAMYAPLVWKDEIIGVLYADATSMEKAFDRDDLRLIQAIALQGAMFIKNFSLQQAMQKEELIKARLLAQFPEKIAERLVDNHFHMSFVSEKVDAVSVLISDVRGFTRISSNMEPERVVKMLNDMFHDLTPLILKYNGTVDKYVGDEIIAVFGSPEPDEQQWEHAVQAALEMQEAIKKLVSSRWSKKTPFEIGIGIHTGPAIHGFIGAPERMEYTVIGSTINIASRYCDAAHPGEILISPTFYERVHRLVEVIHPPRDIETKHEGTLKAYAVKKWIGTKS